MVRGPLSAAIATLLDMGWAPSTPTEWVSHRGEHYEPGADLSLKDAAAIIQDRLVEQAWAKSACTSHLGANLGLGVATFLREAPSLSGERDIDEFVRQSFGNYQGSVAKPLGLRAGVPEKAADVALGPLLAATHPELARQVEDPSSLMLDEELRPVELPRLFCMLGKDYSQLVEKAVAAGL